MFKKLLDFDDRLLHRIYNLKTPPKILVDVLLYLGSLLPTIFLLLFGLIVGIIFKHQFLFVLALKFVVTLLVSGLTFIIFKELVDRRRPYAQDRVKDKFNGLIENRDPVYGSKYLESFPSGHVFTSAMLLVVLYSQLGELSLWITIPFVISMIYLRINLGVHFPSDTIAGLLLGLLTAYIACYKLFFIYEWAWKILLGDTAWILIASIIFLLIVILLIGKRRK